LISDEYQFRRNRDSGEAELFDLRTDPLSLTDIAATLPETVRMFEAALDRVETRVAAVREHYHQPDVPEALSAAVLARLEALGYMGHAEQP
jgi:hypothetical protein